MNLLSLLAVSLLTAEGEPAAEPGFLQKIWNSVVTWFIDERGWVMIVRAVIVILIGLLLIKVIMTVSRKIMNRPRLRGLAGNFLLAILKSLLVFVYLIVIMRVLGIDTSSMIALLAAGGLALSLALQSTLSNFASGMILVSNHPFKEGDFIDAAGVSGTVEKITLFSTKLKTPDNKVVTLPNSSVAGGNIVNYSTEENRRVDLTFGVAYGTDIDKTKKAIEAVLDAHELVLHDEGYTVRLSEQAASALVFVCRCWVKSADYWTVYFDLNERVTEKFGKEGIEIPYNKLDVNVKTEK